MSEGGGRWYVFRRQFVADQKVATQHHVLYDQSLITKPKSGQEHRGQLLTQIANCHLDMGRAYSGWKVACKAVKELAGAACSQEARLVRARCLCHMEKRDEMYYEDDEEHEE